MLGQLLQARRLDKENKELERQIELHKLYYGMVKMASVYMSKKNRKMWLEFHDPRKIDACIITAMKFKD